MKLYTEEQVNEMLNKIKKFHSKESSLFLHLVEHITEYITPIEVPSDKEIEEYDDGSTKLNPRTYYDAFQEGAKWMKEQILNQNK